MSTKLRDLVDRLFKNPSTKQTTEQNDWRALIEDVVRDGGHRTTLEWGKGPGDEDLIRVNVETARGQSQAYASLRGRRIEEAQRVAVLQALRFLGYGIAGHKNGESAAENQENNFEKGEISLWQKQRKSNCRAPSGHASQKPASQSTAVQN
ncbi:MAG: hypothetical protein C4542_05535 [Dehalococcoidia bacterium]|nr:MAG: hypothetical protein C4542_05535 [Dehalococcoidia bacterium]